MRILILTAVTAAALAACNGTTAPISGDYQALPADQVLTNVTHNMTIDGVRNAKLLSDTALIFNDSASMQLRGVDLDLFTETGTVRAHLTSETGELNTDTNRMVARGSVVLVVQGPNGRTVRTEELFYDPQQKRIWSTVRTCDTPRGGGQRCGASFESDDQFQNFRIDRPSGAVELVF